MYVITGATGNTGAVITERLLARGERVRVLGRDAGRLGRLVQKGADPVVADVTDSNVVTRAFIGAKAVYLMIPPDVAAPDVRAFQERVSDALTAATEHAGVEYAVLLSSIGADKADGTGPVIGLHNFEQKLNGIPQLKALYVRAGYFMENLLPQVGVIKSFGMMAGPVRADLRLPMIATRDIGTFAAEALLDLTFNGKQTRELLGQREVTYAEAASLIGKAVAKPDLSYSQLPASQLKPALVQMGMSSNMADLLLTMADALNSGHMVALESRSAQNTTPTPIEQFIGDDFVPRFMGKRAGV
ncbi:MAG TPA: NmrA family NAD(P)-binding protein [bacterium]|nr:NmrA family NAD(P)-binding protein [bacterium]